MLAIKAHFDSKVLVPDEPLDLPRDRPVFITIESVEPPVAGDLASALDAIGDNPADDLSLPTDLSEATGMSSVIGKSMPPILPNHLS